PLSSVATPATLAREARMHLALSPHRLYSADSPFSRGARPRLPALRPPVPIMPTPAPREPPAMPRVRDLLDLPDRIRKMDFTVTLTDGVARPEQTVEQYVVTPRLVDCFDQAIGMIGGAITDGRSQGTYLHGSFGSGKSHFMAMTSLLVAGNEHAWRVPALHPLRARFDWIGKAKVLELHLHMLRQPSLEAAIFPAYLAYLAKHHPSAPLPPLFADEELF